MNNPRLSEFAESELLAELLFRAMNRDRTPEEVQTNVNLQDMVDDFINQFSGEFDAQDVERFIHDNYGVAIKRATVSGYLSKRKTDGLLKKIGTRFIRV